MNEAPTLHRIHSDEQDIKMTARWETLALGSESESPLWEVFHENAKLGRFSSGPSDEAIDQYTSGLLESLPFDGFPTVLLPKRLPAMKMPVGKAMQSRASCGWTSLQLCSITVMGLLAAVRDCCVPSASFPLREPCIPWRSFSMLPTFKA